MSLNNSANFKVFFSELKWAGVSVYKKHWKCLCPFVWCIITCLHLCFRNTYNIFIWEALTNWRRSVDQGDRDILSEKQNIHGGWVTKIVILLMRTRNTRVFCENVIEKKNHSKGCLLEIYFENCWFRNNTEIFCILYNY